MVKTLNRGVVSLADDEPRRPPSAEWLDSPAAERACERWLLAREERRAQKLQEQAGEEEA